MARLRPARCVRDIEGPAWTRYSRRKPRKSYVKSMPHRDLHTFEMGVLKEDYEVAVFLVARDSYQIRDNALEAARQSASRYLDKHLQGNYKFWVRKYPHHVIRENKMLTGAGADRLSKGMRKSFGKPVDLAARIYTGDVVFEVRTYRRYLDDIKEAYRRASQKMSGRYKVEVKELA